MLTLPKGREHYEDGGEEQRWQRCFGLAHWNAIVLFEADPLALGLYGVVVIAFVLRLVVLVGWRGGLCCYCWAGGHTKLLNWTNEFIRTTTRTATESYWIPRADDYGGPGIAREETAAAAAYSHRQCSFCVLRCIIGWRRRDGAAGGTCETGVFMPNVQFLRYHHHSHHNVTCAVCSRSI